VKSGSRSTWHLPAMFNNDMATADIEDNNPDRSNADSSTAGYISETDTTANNNNSNSSTNIHAVHSIQTIIISEKAWGRAELVLVAFLYGTYAVSSRLIYSTEGPPVASVFTFVRQVLANGAFVPIYISSAISQKCELKNKAENEQQWGEGSETQILIDSNDGEHFAEARPRRVRPMWMTALELTCWNASFIMFLNAGLVIVPASLAAFLLETSVVITPLVSVLAGERVKVHVLGGGVLALIGIFLIYSSVMSTAGPPGDIKGCAMIMLAALLRSIYIFRLSKTATCYSVLNLQFTRALFSGVVYAVWFLIDAALMSSADTPLFSSDWFEALRPMWSGWSSPEVWLLLTYNGVATGTISVLLQQQGQKVVPASEANVIISTQIVFAVLLGCVLLGEVLLIKEVIGGLLIIMGAIWVST